MSAPAVVTSVASKNASPASSFSNTATDDVIEIGLLIPKEWASSLIELSKQRQQSVGLIIRSLIRHALIENDASI